MYWDPTYILVLIGVLICAAASLNVKTSFNKFSRYHNARRMTGRDAAEAILHNAGIYDVRIELVQGHFGKYYVDSPKFSVNGFYDGNKIEGQFFSPSVCKCCF